MSLVNVDVTFSPVPTSTPDLSLCLSVLEQVFGIPYGCPSPVAAWLDDLVGTILSQNTSDINSRRAFDALKRRYPTWEELLNGDPQEIEASIRPGGLAATKSRRILSVLTAIQAREGSLSLGRLAQLSDLEAMAYLLALKGVGLKTAACVLMFGLGRDLCPVDTHVHRVANRLGWVCTRHPDQTFAALQSLIPSGKAYSLHVNLIHLGKRLCTARQPDCNHCPLSIHCPAAILVRDY